MNMNMYILGDVFLRNYYQVYDFAGQQAGLAINIHADSATTITDSLPGGLSTIAIILIVVAVVAVLALCAIFGRRHRNNRRQLSYNKTSNHHSHDYRPVDRDIEPISQPIYQPPPTQQPYPGYAPNMQPAPIGSNLQQPGQGNYPGAQQP
jgi:hypothetical protein